MEGGMSDVKSEHAFSLCFDISGRSSVMLPIFTGKYPNFYRKRHRRFFYAIMHRKGDREQ